MSSEDSNNDIAPSAPKGRPKTRAQAKPSESGDESSGSAPQQTSGDESSSDEDLTAMKQDTIKKKLMSKVEHFLLPLNVSHNF